MAKPKPETPMPEWPLPMGHGEYYILVHSARCSYHMAHPFSVIRAREMLWGRLLSCTDPECYVTVGRVVLNRDVKIVKQSECRENYQIRTGVRWGYISRKDRQGIAFGDPKTPQALASWMARQKKYKGAGK